MRFFSWTLSLVVAVHASTALAEDLLPSTQEPREKASPMVTLRSAQLRNLSVREEPADVAPTRERWIDRLGTTKGGFKYQDSFLLGGRKYRFSVRGPVQQDRRLGLTFEVRF